MATSRERLRATFDDVVAAFEDWPLPPEPARDDLLRGIGRLADERFGGRIVKRMLFELLVAVRV